MDTPTEAAEYLTVRELAAELRISLRTAYTLVRTGQIPAVRVGSQLRVPRHALERHLADMLRKPAA